MGKLILLFTLLFCSSSFAKQQLNMAVIGNSVSQGTNAINFIGIWPDYNWASGTKIDSHRMKIERELGVHVVVKNVSIVGATSCLMEKELKLLGNFIPDYTTIEIGTNDLCMLGFNTDIPKHIENVINNLLDRNPNMEIVVVPISKMTSMKSAVGDKMKCRIIWNLMCPRLLASWYSDDEIKEVQKKIDLINDEIAVVANKYYQVYYNKALGDVDIDESWVSFDCFHPSIKGQQAFSDLTWE